MDREILAFWKRFDQKCRDCELNVIDVARATGLKYSNLKNQRSKLILPKTEAAIKIAQTLNTTVEFLLTGKDSESPVLDPVLLKISENPRLLSIASCLPKMNEDQLTSIETFIRAMGVMPATKETEKNAG